MKRLIIKLTLSFIFFVLLIILCTSRSCTLASSLNPKEIDKIKVKICLLKSDEYCLNVELVSVERIVKNDMVEELVRTTLEKLLEGPSKQEKEKLDLWTVIPKEVNINTVKLDWNSKTIHIDFSEQLQNYGGGSFNALYIREQIERTLREFPSIEEVVITVEEEGEKDGILQP